VSFVFKYPSAWNSSFFFFLKGRCGNFQIEWGVREGSKEGREEGRAPESISKVVRHVIVDCSQVCNIRHKIACSPHLSDQHDNRRPVF
jgi:hypothetical protein